MKAYQQNLEGLAGSDTQVVGVDMDSTFSNKAFADQIGVTFPIVSDWGGEVTKQYGIYNPSYKAARRVTFLVGKDGKVKEVHMDKEAVDPTKMVESCKRQKLAE